MCVFFLLHLILGYAPQGGYPPQQQPGFPPQGGYPPQGQPGKNKRKNEIKNEIKKNEKIKIND